MIYVHFVAYLNCACYKPCWKKLRLKNPHIISELTYGFALLIVF